MPMTWVDRAGHCSAENKQPGNPAMAMCWEPFQDNGRLVTFPKFLDTGGVMFCPTDSYTFETHYFWLGNKYGPDPNAVWGSWQWVYPILNTADDPWLKLRGSPTGIINAQARAKDVMLKDWNMDFDHNNILYFGGTVEYLGSRCDWSGVHPELDDAKVWFYGPTGYPDH